MALLDNSDGRPMSLADFVRRERSRAQQTDPVFSGGRVTGERVFTCPDCGRADFREGPTGGLSVNFACCNCLARFNDSVFFIERCGKCTEQEFQESFQRGAWWKPRSFEIREPAEEPQGPDRVFRGGGDDDAA